MLYGATQEQLVEMLLQPNSELLTRIMNPKRCGYYNDIHLDGKDGQKCMGYCTLIQGLVGCNGDWYSIKTRKVKGEEKKEGILFCDNRRELDID